MKFSPYRLTFTLAALGLASAMFSPQFAYARKHKKVAGRHVSAVGDDDASEDQIAADVLDAKLDKELKANLKKKSRKGSNKAAHVLADAYTALMNHNYTEAGTLAKSVQGDELFSDYSNWIQGSAYQEEAKSAMVAKQSKTAANLAQLAYVRFNMILNGDPYSVLVHEAPKQMGISELLWAQGIAPSKQALKHYLVAFQRLNQQHANSEIKVEFVDSFAKTCTKYKNPVCDAWVQKLSPSDERPKAPVLPPRATQVYKAPDLDTVAFDDLMLSVHDRKWADAITKLKAFIDDYPRSALRYRARFQLALAYIQKGQKDDANKTFDGLAKDSPLTFYGLLSAMADGKPIDGAIDTSVPITVKHDPLLSPEEVFRLNRAEILLSEGANELASLELRGIAIRPAQSSPFLMYLAVLNRRAGDYPMVFQILSELIQRSYPGVASQYGLKLVFPIAHYDAIKKYSKENGVDPILVMSLIKQESAFDVHANSGSGASGLMQLMPVTALETVPGITREQLVEADANIHAGSKYLSKLLDHYKGNIVLALAAYNAGPGAVDRWIRESVQEKRNMMQFIEAIPFKETRDYVGSIIRNYYWYSKFVKKAQQPVALSYFWNPYKELNKDVGAPQANPGALPVVPTEDSSPVPGDDDLEKIANELPPPAAASPGPSASISASPSSSPSASPTVSASPSIAPFYGPLPEPTRSISPSPSASGSTKI
jgi:hypothetical protein